MREFSYSTNGGAEFYISVFAEDKSLILKAPFPTPAAMRDFFQSDLNNLFKQKNLPALTEEEIDYCKKIMDDNLPY